MSAVKETGRGFRHAAAETARAKLFSHGGSQAVRLPKAFRFEGAEVAIRKEGDRVILEPASTRPRLPKTPEERAAFWAHIDSFGVCDLEHPPQDLDWPDPPRFDD